MKLLLKIITVLVVIPVTTSNANFQNKYKHGETKSYFNEKRGFLSPEEYYNKALNNELYSTKTEKDLFFLTSFKLVGGKPDGANKGGLYSDANNALWIIKKGQDSVPEYIGSRIMNLLMGPLSPQVELLNDAPEFTASRVLPNFLMKMELLKNLVSKPIIGDLELSIAMDLMGLDDRNNQNLGYIDESDKFLAVRVDFDESFEFMDDKALIYAKTMRKSICNPKGLESAIRSFYAIPDEMILYVLADAYINLQVANITVDYADYAELGFKLIARKNVLKDSLNQLYEVEKIYEEIKTNPAIYMERDSKRIGELTMALYGIPALHWAGMKNLWEMVDFLIQKSTSINEQDERGRTALHWAAYCNEPLEIVYFLLNKGAAVNVKDNDGQTPFHHATKENQLTFAHLLLKKGTDINEKDNDGQTALHLVSKGTGFTSKQDNSQYYMVNFLLQEGADIRARNNNNQTPLHYAVAQNDLNLVKLLLEKGADINARDDDDRTPLHVAVDLALTIFEITGINKLDVVELLLRKSADRNIEDKDSNKPLDLVIEKNHLKLTEMLKRTAAT